MKKTKLFDDFQEISSKGWKQKIQADLKGADYNDILIWEAPEGIKVKPFYHQDDLSAKAPLQIDHPENWSIGQVIYAASAANANKKALEAVTKGAESIVFTLPNENITVKELLQGMDLKEIPIHFNFQFFLPDLINKVLDLPGVSVSRSYFNIDPISHFERTGNWYKSQNEDFMRLIAMANNNQLANLISIDMALYQNAGANIVQQLAYGMAHACEYLNLLNEEARVKELRYTFKVAIGGNYFFEIAKLRALRNLWKTLAKEFGINDQCHICAMPSHRNKTIYDFNTNMLRTSMESMAAVLGGADTVCNLPYDSIYHKDNEFGERMARNQLLILKNEVHLDKVSNAAAGAFYIEKLSLQLAEKALELFVNIETGGGLIKSLKEHTIQKKIGESAFKEQELFNNEDEILVGSNAYRNDKDRMKANLERDPFIAKSPRKTLIEPIIEKRLATKLEQDRLKQEEGVTKKRA